MPSVSSKQHRFMEAIAHSQSFAAKAGVPQKVGKDFAAADQKVGHMANKGYSGSTQKFAQGGPVLGKNSEFLKTPDEFREDDRDKGSDENWGKGMKGGGTSAPAAKGKSLPTIKSKQ